MTQHDPNSAQNCSATHFWPERARASQSGNRGATTDAQIELCAAVERSGEVLSVTRSMHNVFSPSHHPATCARSRARRGDAIQVSPSASNSCRSPHVCSVPRNRTESRQPCQRHPAQCPQYSQHLQHLSKCPRPHQLSRLSQRAFRSQHSPCHLRYFLHRFIQPAQCPRSVAPCPRNSQRAFSSQHPLHVPQYNLHSPRQCPRYRQPLM